MEYISVLQPYRMHLKCHKKSHLGGENFFYFKPKKKIHITKNLDSIKVNYNEKEYLILLHGEHEPRRIVIPSKKSTGRRFVNEYTQPIIDIDGGAICLRVNEKTHRLKMIVVKFVRVE